MILSYGQTSGLPKPIRQQVDSHDKRGHTSGGRQAYPRCIYEKVSALADHQSPIGRWGLDAEAQKAKRRSKQDSVAQAHRAFYRQHGYCVGKNFSEDYVWRRFAPKTSALDKFE